MRRSQYRRWRWLLFVRGENRKRGTFSGACTVGGWLRQEVARWASWCRWAHSRKGSDFVESESCDDLVLANLATLTSRCLERIALWRRSWPARRERAAPGGPRSFDGMCASRVSLWAAPLFSSAMAAEWGSRIRSVHVGDWWRSSHTLGIVDWWHGPQLSTTPFYTTPTFKVSDPILRDRKIDSPFSLKLSYYLHLFAVLE